MSEFKVAIPPAVLALVATGVCYQHLIFNL